MTRAAADATLALLYQSARIFGKAKLFTTFAPEEYLALGAGLHPVASTAGTGDFVEPFLDYTWATSELLVPAVSGTDREVSGIALAEEPAVGILAAEAGEVVHGAA